MIVIGCNAIEELLYGVMNISIICDVAVLITRQNGNMTHTVKMYVSTRENKDIKENFLLPVFLYK